MDYSQIIDEILSFAKTQKEKDNNGEYKVQLKSLLRHFENKYPELDYRPIKEMIDEIDARGWLLECNSSFLIFDPAIFS